MIFSVPKKGIQWTLAFDPDSVTTAVTDLVQNLRISSQEITLAAWQMLLSQRQDFLDNHLPRVPITQNQQGTMEMRDKILSSVGAQDLDTSSYHISDLEDLEFNWENSQLDMEAVFRPTIDTPFLQLQITIFRRRDQLKIPIVLDEEEDKRMLLFLLHRNSSLSEPTEPPWLQRSCAFGAKIENVADYVCRNLFQ